MSSGNIEWQKLQQDMLGGENNPLALPDGASPTDPHFPGATNRDKCEAENKGSNSLVTKRGEKKCKESATTDK